VISSTDSPSTIGEAISTAVYDSTWNAAGAAAAVGSNSASLSPNSSSSASHHFLSQPPPATSSPLGFNQLNYNTNASSYAVNTNTPGNYWNNPSSRYQNAYANQYHNYSNYAAVAAAVAAANNYTPNVYQTYHQPGLYSTASQSNHAPAHFQNQSVSNQCANSSFYGVDQHGNTTNPIFNQLAALTSISTTNGKMNITNKANSSLLVDSSENGGDSSGTQHPNDSGFDTFNETSNHQTSKLANQTVGSMASSSSELSTCSSSSPSPSSPKMLSHQDEVNSHRAATLWS
jgi:hypothetical protein